MMHWRANRLLPFLAEDELTTDEAAHVRAHVENCVHCDLRLREYQACETLLRRMPRSLVPQSWTLSAELGLRAVAGIPSALGISPADGMAFRAAAATASMAITLLLVAVGPLAPNRPEPRDWSGLLPSAERASAHLVSHYEPPGGWGQN